MPPRSRSSLSLPPSPRSLARRSAAAFAVATTTLGICAAVAAAPAVAVPVSPTGVTPAVTTLLSESFAGSSTINRFVLPGSDSGNRACLTASNDTSAQPLPGCAENVNGRQQSVDPWCAMYGYPAEWCTYDEWLYGPDAQDRGALRLTDYTYNMAAGAFLDGGLPTAAGLDVTFDSYQWGGNVWTGLPADGLTLSLAATDPENPQAPTRVGQLGAGLGYASISDQPGLANAYLGVGVDVIGSFATNAFGSTTTTCEQTGNAGQSVTVRGPGNGLDGYCAISTTASSGALNQPSEVLRPAQGVPVQFAVNPLSAQQLTRAGDPVPAHSWLVAWTSYSGERQVSTGPLPSATDMATAGIPTSWYDSETGLPKSLSLGFTAGTGGGAEFHAVSNLLATTLTPAAPQHQLSVSDSVDGAVTAGSTGSILLTPSLDGGSREGDTVTLTTTFPAGLLPGTVVSDEYDCVTQAQVVTCTRTSAAGGDVDLPTLAIPFTGTSALAGPQTVTAELSTPDSAGVTASRDITVTAAQAITFAPLSTPASVGTSVDLVATGGGSGRPVTFSVEDASSPTPLLTAASRAAVCTVDGDRLTFEASGDCVVTARQEGADHYLAAPDVTQTIAVQKLATATSMTLSPTTSVHGQSVTATASVSGTDAGLVQFAVDGVPVGDPVALSEDGTATSVDLAGPTVPLAAGSHPVSATFTPSDSVSYAVSTGTQVLTVDAAATTTQLLVGSDRITATVAPVAPGAGSPTGTVQFSVDGLPVGSAPVVDGTATLEYSTPADRSRRVAAAYDGAQGFLPSSGSTARNNPVVTATVTSAKPKSRSGWYTTPVRVSFTCTPTSAALVAACPTPVTLSKQAAAQSVSRTVLAVDGGATTVVVSGIDIDSVAPTARITGATNGARYFAASPRVACTSSDKGSGIASCTIVKQRSGTVETITATATDKAGNQARTSIRVSVAPIVVQGAAYANGAYSVRRGQTYTLLVASATRPTYVNAAPAPNAPRGASVAFRQTGKGTWALGVTMDRAMRPGYWNLGVLIGGRTTPVRVQVR